MCALTNSFDDFLFLCGARYPGRVRTLFQLLNFIGKGMRIAPETIHGTVKRA
jgi:hypothetical protein